MKLIQDAESSEMQLQLLYEIARWRSSESHDYDADKNFHCRKAEQKLGLRLHAPLLVELDCYSILVSPPYAA